VWALADAGVRVVVSSGFADIFYANALRNGLVPVVLEPGLLCMLTDQLEIDSSIQVVVDLAAQTVRSGSILAGFDFDPFAKHCVLNGLDELAYLLEQAPQIEAFEARHPPQVDTTGGVR
jgi:3-isopropylmalate/(R)-2-methylmalate dehydratase small subunit